LLRTLETLIPVEQVTRPLGLWHNKRVLEESSSCSFTPQKLSVLEEALLLTGAFLNVILLKECLLLFKLGYL
jgi:hypothetical protein